jgi:DNA segregation ATPase FtsK/SpoIIIE, S-DNA-T family
MRSAGNFSSEWGYLAPAPSFARTARIVLVATAIGATAGAGVVLTLVDRSPRPERTSVAARAIVTSVPEAAAPVASQMSAPSIPPAAAPPPASPPAKSPVAPSDVAIQSPNHALASGNQPADRAAAAASTEANASAQAPPSVTPSENPASANAGETSATQTSAAPANATDAGATQANSEPANAGPRSGTGVATLSEPSASGSAADTADGQEPASAQKKVKHHVASDRAPFPGLGRFFRRFFVAHAARPNYSNR